MLKDRVNSNSSISDQSGSATNPSAKNASDKAGNSDLVAMQTLGEGDCAFHAVFGEYDEISSLFVCKDVDKQRQTLKINLLQLLQGKKVGILWPLVKNAIQERIMANDFPECAAAESILQEYNKLCKEDEKNGEIIWKEIEQEVVKLPELNEFLQKQRGNKIREKIHCCQNEDEHTKKEFERLFPATLKSKFDNMPKSEFDWDKALELNTDKTKDILEEYAKLLSTLGTELLPVEIKIIAHVFNIQVNFYNTDLQRKTMFFQATYGSTDTNVVCIRFNGIDHYERLLPQKEFDEHEQSKQERRKKLEDDFRKFNAPKSSTNLPKAILCYSCETILRNPVVKAKIEKTQDYLYFHETCFKRADKAKNQDNNNKFFFFKSMSIKKQAYALSDNEKQLLSTTLLQHGYALNADDDPKIKDANLRIELFTRLPRLLKSIPVTKKGDDFLDPDSTPLKLNTYLKLARDVTWLDQTTGQIKIQLQNLELSEITHGNLTAENVLSWKVAARFGRYAIAPAVTGGILAYAVVTNELIAISTSSKVAGGSVAASFGVIGLAIVFGGRYYANVFRESIRNALELIELDKFSEAEKLLAREFGEGEDGRYALTRAVKWTATEYNEYAIAHLIRGQCALKTGSEKAYAHFTKAYNDAKDTTLGGFALLGLIRILAPEAKMPVTKPNGEKMNEAERTSLFKLKLEELQKKHSPIVEALYAKIFKFSQSILEAVTHSNNDPKALLQYAKARHILNFKEAYLFRYLKPHGRRLEVIFIFLQGVMYLLGHMQKNDKSFITSAKEQLEYCWKLIKQQKLDRSRGQEEIDIVENIRGFIIEFAKDIQSTHIFPNQNMNSWLLNLDLMPDFTKLVPVKDIINIANKYSNLPAKLETLPQIIHKIIQEPDFAAFELEGDNNWFHVFSHLSKENYLSKDLIQAIQKLEEAGISPFRRNMHGHTAFYYLRKNNDPNNLCKHFEKACGVINVGTDKEPNFLIGVEEESKQITDFFNAIKSNPKTKAHFLLLSGPPGVGKTMLIKLIAKRCKFKITELSKGSKGDMYKGQLETRVSEYFDSAIRSGDDVCLFVDEIDAVVPIVQGHAQVGFNDQRTVIRLIQEKINELVGTRVILVGATNYPENIDSAVRNRAENVVFKLVNKKQRLTVLNTLLREYQLENSDILDRVAEATSGWSPRALGLYIEKVLRLSDRKPSEKKQGTKDGNQTITEETTVLSNAIFISSFEDSRELFKKDYPHLDIDPSRLSAINQNAFDGLILTDEAKQVSESIRDFLNNPNSYFESISNPKNSYLLYGPPGTGKTSFARAISQVSNAVFVNVRPSDALVLNKIFEFARQFEKTIIFIDEIDKVGGSRNDPLTVFFQTGMDGLRQNKNALVIIGATNYKNKIAEPILDRFEPLLMPLPNTSEEYRQIFNIHLKGIKNIKFENDFFTKLDELAKWACQQKISPRNIELSIKSEAQKLITQRNLYKVDSQLTIRSLQKAITNRNQAEKSVDNEDIASMLAEMDLR